ncbi:MULTISPECIES: hypothetical protein [unclassified Nodularia (in: cyanobacteria)]|uniref:hypothetical protein n=1 Tax=unclassified Nodularia (in: cyanobacteria) TaxID=2656917 RepID=UPI0018815FC8|nr:MULTISPECIES: hypothetical protein [unclassified Nodularia (in: cyanobacteria)]MBE9200647.1 hypothetical protein [Nodularia sp. LEGE 06071]MCC2694720.1 hypothetical protein [Nodularia sp. LEGE 04288]
MSKKKLSKPGNQQGSFAVEIFKSKTMRLTTPVLAMAGWLAMIAPSMAVTTSYANDYRVCTARLLNLGITEQAVSQGCAKALRPRDLSACVVKINQQTQISPVDALSSCEQARRSEDFSTCVVGITTNTPGVVHTAVLNYCGRSLLPERFAQCVVGLRSEIDLPPTQAMDTCIDASDRVSGFSPASAPPNRVPTEFSPSFEVTPIPGNPGSR